jgi:hypothetical protein
MRCARASSRRLPGRSCAGGERKYGRPAVTDGSGRLVAHGKVRLISLEAGSALAGEEVKVKR